MFLFAIHCVDDFTVTVGVGLHYQLTLSAEFGNPAP